MDCTGDFVRLSYLHADRSAVHLERGEHLTFTKNQLLHIMFIGIKIMR